MPTITATTFVHSLRWLTFLLILIADTKEELQSILASEGIEMSLEEIDNVLEAVANQPEDGELNEDMLDIVNGGVAVAGTILVTSAFVHFAASVGRLGLAYMTRRR